MKKIATFMFIALASVALVSCGGEEKDDKKKEGWSEEQEKQFMKTCVDRASENPQINGEEYCACMIVKVKEKYPNPADAGSMDMEWLQEEAAKCLAQ